MARLLPQVSVGGCGYPQFKLAEGSLALRESEMRGLTEGGPLVVRQGLLHS